MRNPRKVYPIDAGLIPVVGWVRAVEDLEVDFHAEHLLAESLLVQVSLEMATDATWEREVRSLEAAATEHPDARPLLITLHPTPPSRPLPGRIEWRVAAQCGCSSGSRRPLAGHPFGTALPARRAVTDPRHRRRVVADCFFVGMA